MRENLAISGASCYHRRTRVTREVTAALNSRPLRPPCISDSVSKIGAVGSDQLITIQANWQHGVTEDDHDLCNRVLTGPAVNRAISLLSYPGSIIVHMNSDASVDDAEGIAACVRQVPHLTEVRVLIQDRVQPDTQEGPPLWVADPDHPWPPAPKHHKARMPDISNNE